MSSKYPARKRKVQSEVPMALVAKRSPSYYAAGRFTAPSVELKYFDTAISFSADATGEVPATGQLCLIPSGATEATRIGRKCTVKSIAMHGIMVQVPGAATAIADQVTMFLIWDKQCNGAAASASDVFTTNNPVTANHNLANSERFVVLKKWQVLFQPGAGVQAAYNQTIRQWSVYKKCNIPLEFSSTTGAITEIKSNNLFLYCGTAGGTDDTINVTGTCRLRFSDQ